VHIDKNHIEIILRNLTSNAIKFSKQDSTIQFNLKDKGDFVEIFVIDEGTGLTKDQASNILNNATMKSSMGTHGEKGIGLGLLLTKEFIEINGGNLYVESELNKGTTMSFTIPKSN
jgi:signal transduction histidine kinase